MDQRITSNPSYVIWETLKKYLCMDYNIVEIISEVLAVGTGISIEFATSASVIQIQKAGKLISPADIPPI